MSTRYPAVHPEVAAGYRRFLQEGTQSFTEEPGLHVGTINICEEWRPGPVLPFNAVSQTLTCCCRTLLQRFGGV